MIFNSIEFLIYLPIVLILYSITPNRFRWLTLLVASYWFYMSWNAVYILLIVLSTLVDWIVSLKIYESIDQKLKKRWLYVSLFMNLGLLIFFKYYHFINTSLGNILPVHNFLLPVGISFYTFQTLSYTIDVYRGRLVPENHIGRFALYVSFFPQLVAGPIERAVHLLPQMSILNNIKTENLSVGLQKVVQGLFKKVVIADRVAILTNTVYTDPGSFSGPQILLATFYFGIQIYCDFSGYSDIAIGVAKIFNIDLMENFKRPYLSRSIKEFWAKWHISLSSWFKDYLYIPLGGSRVSISKTYFNLIITFLISGLWHGANWTFLIWGLYHGVILVIEYFYRSHVKTDKYEGNYFISFIRWVKTIILIFIGWMIFRANSFTDLKILLTKLFSGYADFNPVSDLQGLGLNKTFFIWSVLVSFSLLIFQYFDRHNKVKLLIHKNMFLKYSYYVILIIIIILMGVSNNESQFIYFQF